MNNFDKILTSLNLSTSGTREDSLMSVVKAVLIDEMTPLTIKQIKERTVEIFEFEPHEQEISTVISQLDDQGICIFRSQKAILQEKERKKLLNIDSNFRDEEEGRCENFKNFLKENYPKIITEDYETLWKGFLEYLYQAFFHYGESAILFVHPNHAKDNNGKLNNTEILVSVANDIGRSDLIDTLKSIVDRFYEFASKQDIDFVDSLGQKALSFSALGLDPSLAKDAFNSELINWVLFLDTNFLFSLLDLHINVEDEACKELIKLIECNPDYIKVKLYYSDITLKELRHKKEDFKFVEEKLTKPAIKALLRSDELDEFSKRYYEGLLNDPDNTLHPAVIVDIAHTTLKSKKIDIFQTSPQRKVLDDSFMGVKIQEYQRYIDNLNETRREFAQSKPGNKLPREIYRSDSQKDHDISLREVILLLRGKKSFKTLNQARYFGVTLDDLLIRFDSYDIKKKGLEDYPTFFKPSFLLNQLIKFLPVKTDNYKKAFIKAVSARGFNTDINTSSQVIKIVSYLRSQGIDNEEVLLNIITEKAFLEKYREESKKEDFVEKGFYEAEINKLFSEKQSQLHVAETKLKELEKNAQIETAEKSKLREEKEEKEQQANLYLAAVKMLNQKVEKLESKVEANNNQPVLNFEEEAIKQKNTKLENAIIAERIKRLNLENSNRSKLRTEYLKREIRKWQRFSILWFFLSLLPLLLYLGYTFSSYTGVPESFLDSLKNNKTLFIGIPVLLLIINVFTGKLIYDRHWNESNKKAFKEQLEIPKSLQVLNHINELD